VISLLETAEWWMFHAAADRAVLYVMWVTHLLTATACYILMRLRQIVESGQIQGLLCDV
jgi:hypothetical protein